MITHYFKTLKDGELKTIEAPRNGVWSHVVSPSEADIAELVSLYALDETVLEDARDFFEVPRLERSGGATYCFTRYPFDDKDEDIDTAPLLFVMGESFVITVALREVPQFKPFLEGRVTINTTQKTKLFIQLMDAVTNSFEKELVRLRRAVHRNRIKLRRIGPHDIERLVSYENTLNDVIAALVPTNTWLNQLTHSNYIQLFNEDMDLMEDLVIDNTQLVDSSRSILKTIQNIRGASEAIMTSTLNTTIQRLTIITILLTIPTIVASLYGMNVPIPHAESPWAFWLIITAIVTVVSVAVFGFKKNGWL